MDGDPGVTSNVTSFRGICAGRNVQVQPASKVTDPGDVRAMKPLRGQYTEIASRDKSSKKLECVGHEYHRVAIHMIRLLLRVAGDGIYTRGLAPGEGFEPSRPQRTTGFLSQIPGLGSLCWDLPRTRLGNPGIQL